MRMGTKALLLLLLPVLLAIPLHVAAAQPPPQRFHGTVKVRTSPSGVNENAPAGTTVSAVIGGVECGALYVTASGRYGNAGAGSYLLVWYGGEDGATIQFYVDGNAADQTAQFHSGQVSELDLTAYIPSSGDLATPTPVPPALTGSGTVAPAGGEVTTYDGRCDIYFYPGAFSSDAEVTIEPVSCAAAPQGFAVGSTCFRITATVDGVPVLQLGAGMSIDVRYRSADLAAAGGDAASLRLARYDEDSDAWELLATGVDASAWTLSATTDHLSDWVVLGRADGGGGGVTWWTILVIALAAAVIVALVVLVVARRSRRRPPPRRRPPAPRPRPAS
ncbi:MAG: hypothetical protein SVP26_09030 [Chloroflexota bacterium]|nr:hypothetical protein [Chloroflexota bacterium]